MTTAPCKFLAWDSAFFGLRIARVEAERLTDESVEQVLQWCRAQQIRCLYFLCAADSDQSVLLAERHGFHLVDVRVELAWRAPTADGQTLTASPGGVRLFQESDLGELQRIAKDAYETTRFYYDSHFPRERVEALYREWVAKSCRGFADATLVAAQESKVAGFVTCHLDAPGAGRVGLIGVRADARGLGLGRLLIQAAQGYFAGRGVNEVSIVTQGRNLAAQRLYQANGFRSSKLHLWYHKWFEAEQA